MSTVPKFRGHLPTQPRWQQTTQSSRRAFGKAVVQRWKSAACIARPLHCLVSSSISIFISDGSATTGWPKPAPVRFADGTSSIRFAEWPYLLPRHWPSPSRRLSVFWCRKAELGVFLTCRIPDDHMVACETGAGGCDATLSWPASAYCS